jgi:hypothetical protein
MNSKYVFSYRRFLLWKKKTIIGHSLDQQTDIMNLYLEDGGIETIPQWIKKGYSVKLGQDWVLAVKKNAEKTTGVDLKLEV